MPLLERESQVAALAEYAVEASAGQGRVVLVSGEAGVGKSSLVERLEHDPATSGATWAWGACDGLFTPRPLAPLHDIAGVLGGELAAGCAAGASRDELFATLLRELTDPARFSVFVIEDVHWADEATLDLLRFVGRRIRPARGLLIVTFRDDGLGAGDPLRVVLGELATSRTTRRLTLPRLSADAVNELARGSDLEPGELYRLTGGNPFYLTEILRHGVAELPSSARDAVLAPLTGLPAEAREVVDAAALIGARVEWALLARVTDADPAAVDRVLETGILTDDGTRLRFRHEIARLAVEQAIGVHRRPPMHQRILAALLESGDPDDAQLAFHAEGAADAAQVLCLAPRAARRAAALGSHREAAAQYERALRFAADAPMPVRAGLSDALSGEYSLVDRWPEAARASQEALALWRACGDPYREGDTLVRLSRVMWRLCRGPESHAASAQSIAVLEPLGPSPELARAYVLYGADLMEQADHGDALAVTRKGRLMAEQFGLTDVLSDALNTEACVLYDLGQDWRPTMDQALSIAVDAGLQEQAGRAFANMYTVLCEALRFPEGERVYQDGVAYCDDHDMSTFGKCLRGERCHALARMGRWDEAISLALQLIGVPAASVNRLNPLNALGMLRARRGDPGVWECLDETAASTDQLAEAPFTVEARLTRAEARWLERDPAAAQAELALAEAAAAGCSETARARVAAWRRRITGQASAGPQDQAVVIEPYASEVAGDPARAARLWDELGCPYDAALSLLGSTDEALLRVAHDRLDRLGAVAAARVARRRMRELGCRSVPAGARSATRADPAGLTPREREVLALVCEGQTNDEISSRLFISVKTVDHHVSAVLGKLGVGSRKVAAVEAVRRGLVGAGTGAET